MTSMGFLNFTVLWIFQKAAGEIQLFAMVRLLLIEHHLLEVRIIVDGGRTSSSIEVWYGGGVGWARRK